MEQAFELLLKHLSELYNESADNLTALLFEEGEDGTLTPLPDATEKLNQLKQALQSKSATTDEQTQAEDTSAQNKETESTDETSKQITNESEEQSEEANVETTVSNEATEYDQKVMEISGYENEEGFAGEQLLSAAFEYVRQDAEMQVAQSGGAEMLPPTEDVVKQQPWYNNQINTFEIKIGALSEEVTSLNSQLQQQQNQFNKQLEQATLLEKLRLEFYDYVKQRNPLEANYKLFNDLVRGAFDQQFTGLEVSTAQPQTSPQGTKQGVAHATGNNGGLQFTQNGELLTSPETGNTMGKTELFEQAYVPYFTDRTSGKQIQATAAGGAKQVPKTPKGKGVSYKGKIYGSVKEVRADKELSQEEMEKIIYKLNKA